MKVVAAILIYEKKVLAFKRPYAKNKPQISLKYEFPGGKVKKNETESFSLKRELIEELELKVNNLKIYFKTSHNYVDYKVDISFYISYIESLNFNLNVHDEYKIVNVNDLKNLDWLQADYAVIDHIQKFGFPKN